MGAKFFQIGTSGQLRKCSERRSDSCDPLETDGCCAVIPCDYCLEFETYDGIQYGTATFSASGWAGRIAGAAFFGFWERGYKSGTCEFVVTLNEVEIYRISCYHGQTCRDSSDEAGVTIEYESGILRWIKQEFKPLPYRIDEVTGCTVYFCGDCECTCECLCVTLTNVYGISSRGELCGTLYPCADASWAGTVGGREISLALSHDIYGECVLVSIIDGVEEAVTSVEVCKAISATISLSNGDVLSVTCKLCSCDLGDCEIGCCLPIEYDNPLYPGGSLKPLPFDLTGCGTTLSGTFRPLEPGTLSMGSCGPCGTYTGDFAGLVNGTLKIESGMTCMDTPCSVGICLVLECVEPSSADCCSGIRLWIGSTGTLEGGTADGPSFSIGGCGSWKLVSPSSCTCDAETGIIAEFSISIQLVHVDYTTGPCIGQPTSCTIVCENLTLSI